MSNNSGKTLRGQAAESAPKKKRKLPEMFKVFMTIFGLLPVVLLVLYLIGVWDLKIVDGKLVKDGWDQFVMAAGCFSGLIQVILIWFAFYYYETE